jgi:hypothetical protein
MQETKQTCWYNGTYSRYVDEGVLLLQLWVWAPFTARLFVCGVCYRVPHHILISSCVWLTHTEHKTVASRADRLKEIEVFSTNIQAYWAVGCFLECFPERCGSVVSVPDSYPESLASYLLPGHRLPWQKLFVVFAESPGECWDYTLK